MAAPVRPWRAVAAGAALLRTELARLRSRSGRADIALFHDFAPSPSGGGHQFLRALTGEFQRRGLSVELGRISAGTPACLFNSFNFEFRRLRRFADRGARMVHRVDGPIGTYRGFDDGTDDRIAAINRELADITILQSRFSLEKHLDLGIDLRDPVVIPNAVDPAIFHAPEAREPLDGRKVRVIASSWSLNPRKGAEIFAWLDRHLDRERYELMYLGQPPVDFEWVTVVGPLGSAEVAAELRRSDVYVAASRDDPCSNALLEALACGLPVAYLDSGGHPELVGEGGLAFHSEEELPDVLDRLVAELDGFRAAISTPRIADVANRYLDVLGLSPNLRA